MPFSRFYDPPWPRALIVTAFVVGVLWVDVAGADGLYVPHIGQGVANTADQQAIMVFGEHHTWLALRTGFQGDATAFSWVVPVAQLLTADDVSTVSSEVFEFMDSFTRPQVLRFELACGTYLGCAQSDDAGTLETTGTSVTRFSSFRVGGYQLDVLSADDSRELATWLDREGYQVPQGAAAVFDSYVSRGFFFVAIKFEGSEVQEAGAGSPDAGFGEPGGAGGGAEPAPGLLMRFEGEMYTFPLLISSLSTKDDVDVLIHTLGPTRYRPAEGSGFGYFDMSMPAHYQGDDFDGFYRQHLLEALERNGGRSFAVEYAGPLPESLVEIFQERGLLPDTDEHWFVTRFKSILGPSAMDRDLVFTRETGDMARKKTRVRVITGYQEQDAGLAAAFPLDLLAVAGLGLLAVRRRRARA